MAFCILFRDGTEMNKQINQQAVSNTDLTPFAVLSASGEMNQPLLIKTTAISKAT